MYLLSSPANVNHLMESIAQLKAGKAQPRELIRNEKPKKQKQADREKRQPDVYTECVG
jgi:hypothetical protein